MSQLISDYMLSVNEKMEKINEITEESICEMIGNIPDNLINSLGQISKIGEQGENSIVYKIKDKGISIKIMKNTDKNKREIDFYMYFSSNYNNDYLNFPVVYRDIECMACNNDEMKNEPCFIIISELYDGSLKSIKQKLSKEQIISLVAQIIYSCSILEQLELVHGDLHSGNILYKNVDENDTIEAQIGDSSYAIKTFGKLWVLWDFGNMTYTGEITPETGIKALDTIKTDFHKIIPLVNKSYLTEFIYNNELKNASNTQILMNYLYEKYPNIISKISK